MYREDNRKKWIAGESGVEQLRDEPVPGATYAPTPTLAPAKSEVSESSSYDWEED